MLRWFSKHENDFSFLIPLKTNLIWFIDFHFIFSCFHFSFVRFVCCLRLPRILWNTTCTDIIFYKKSAYAMCWFRLNGRISLGKIVICNTEYSNQLHSLDICVTLDAFTKFKCQWRTIPLYSISRFEQNEKSFTFHMLISRPFWLLDHGSQSLYMFVCVVLCSRESFTFRSAFYCRTRHLLIFRLWNLCGMLRCKLQLLFSIIASCRFHHPPNSCIQPIQICKYIHMLENCCKLI